MAGVSFFLSLLFVFLILAALYESWWLPVSVLLSTPVGVFGSLGALYLRRLVTGAFLPPILVHIGNNVYAEIVLVMILFLVVNNPVFFFEFSNPAYAPRV